MFLFFMVLTAAEVSAKPQALVEREGVVRVRRGFPHAIVSLEHDGGADTLAGDLAGELRSIQSARVAVRGTPVDGKVEVLEYHILDMGRGRAPMVGNLIRSGERLGFVDKPEAEPIPLSVGPRVRAHMERRLGAKIWLFGKLLVSGELKVLRYGVLRPAKKTVAKTSKVHTKKEKEQK